MQKIASVFFEARARSIVQMFTLPGIARRRQIDIPLGLRNLCMLLFIHFQRTFSVDFLHLNTPFRSGSGRTVPLECSSTTEARLRQPRTPLRETPEKYCPL